MKRTDLGYLLFLAGFFIFLGAVASTVDTSTIVCPTRLCYYGSFPASALQWEVGVTGGLLMGLAILIGLSAPIPTSRQDV